MTKYAETHEEWLVALKGTANRWHHKYPFLEEDELYSELLVAYAKALTIPLNEGVKFDTIMTWQKRSVLQAFLREAWKPKNHGYTVCSYEEMVDEGMDIEVVHEILSEVDDIQLDEEALKVLEYMMEHEIVCDNRNRKRVGVATVARDVVRNIEGISYRGVCRALERLRTAYLGCTTA